MPLCYHEIVLNNFYFREGTLTTLTDRQIERKFRGKYAPLESAYEALRDHIMSINPDINYYIKTIYIGFDIKSKVFVVVYFTDKGLEVCMRLDPPILDEPFHDARHRKWAGITTAFHLQDPDDLTKEIKLYLKKAYESTVQEA